MRKPHVVVYPPGSVWGAPTHPVVHIDPAPLRGVPLCKLQLSRVDDARNQPSAYLDRDGDAVRPPFVYFVTALGYLKVGYSGASIRTRLRGLQTSCPTEITVEAIMPGTLEEERYWHRLFAPMRSSGEWFRITPDLEAVVDLCRAGGLDLGPSAVIPGQKKKWDRQKPKSYGRSALEHLACRPSPVLASGRA